ncbi:hypothetical protein [Klebsiella aerogenes]|uniref:hypothetical protein n=1 Tax=Klebsiella aerogenes TaxID=548 RepID=UPI0007505494|nr:hypothetical protein [Klebsiella aerogenes]AXY31198.1 hypothetical protein CEQ05_24030 [Klebsiella aerogenes]EKZ6348288.1 hypothetical protein [Klebsiella aerogenes]KUQ34175.1 hypothetical protein AWI14_18060 [Klebsiella aerogenes]KZR35014.1 hypothetical protein A3N60_09665 [Klebsiella aerogenes]HBQ2464199.1 hypothetical protein [Klebsiella aerogenes]
MGDSMDTAKKVKFVEEADGFVDAFAEVASITTYESQSGSLVNICFMRDFITPYFDESGQPSSSQLYMKKVASVTLDISRAKALHEALGAALNKKGGGK